MGRECRLGWSGLFLVFWGHFQRGFVGRHGLFERMFLLWVCGRSVAGTWWLG